MKASLGFRDAPTLTGDMVKSLIEKIIVHNESSVNVSLRFGEEYEQLKSGFPSLEVAENE